MNVPHEMVTETRDGQVVAANVNTGTGRWAFGVNLWSYTVTSACLFASSEEALRAAWQVVDALMPLAKAALDQAPQNVGANTP